MHEMKVVEFGVSEVFLVGHLTFGPALQLNNNKKKENPCSVCTHILYIYD